MKLHQIRLLTDENMSPKVVAGLRQHGMDILDTKEQQWHGADDEALMTIAYQEQRFVLTHDADFGTLAINQGKPCYGILYLRLRNMKPTHVCRVCEELFQHDLEITPHTIWVIEEARIRIRSLLEED
jgi:predicted nuclease of predicted toxin-antitoxin system